MRRYSSDGPEVVVVAAAEEAKAEGAKAEADAEADAGGGGGEAAAGEGPAGFIDEAERWRVVLIIMGKSPAFAEVSSSEETLATLFFRLG